MKCVFLRYRAKGTVREDVSINVPVLLLWGERDSYLSLRLTEGLSAWVPNLRVVRFPDVSHWIQNDAPERVTQSLLYS